MSLARRKHDGTSPRLLLAAMLCIAVAATLPSTIASEMIADRHVATSHAYCVAPSPDGRCLRQHPAAMWMGVWHKDFCRAVCDDDVESAIVEMVRHKTTRWLSLNATVFEAPGILETLMKRRVSDNLEAQGGVGDDATRVSQQVLDQVDWQRIHRLDDQLRASRVMIPLHLSSAHVYESVRRRLQQVHLQAVNEFDKADAHRQSPLFDAVQHFYPPDGAVPVFERHWPHQMSLPTFVTFQYSTKHCKTCPQGLAAFHRLINTYEYLCARDQRAVASCSPVTYFVAFPVDTFLSVVPQVTLTKHPLIHVNPSSGERKESRRAQRVTDTMSPFSYYLEHTSLLSDYLSFLVVNEVLQLRFLSAEEASELRKKLQDIQEKRAEMESRVALQTLLVPPAEPAGTPGEVAESANATQDLEELQRLKSAEQNTGKVRSIQEMLVLVILRLEALDDDEDSLDFASKLAPYTYWYSFPSPWPRELQDDSQETETGLLGSAVAVLCDILSGAWICLVIWVALYSTFGGKKRRSDENG